MRYSFFFLSLLALLVCAMPVHAVSSDNKIIPPDKSYPSNKPTKAADGGCDDGKVLGWTGKRVACLDPSKGIAIGECDKGTVMSGIINGTMTCVNPTPRIICGEGKAIKKIKEGEFECIDVDEGTPGIVALDCGSGRVLHKAIDGKLTCISTSSLTAQCSRDLVLKGIVDGVPDCVAGPSSGNSGQPTVNCPKGTIVQSFDSEGNQVCIEPAIVGNATCPSGQSLLSHTNRSNSQGEITDCILWDAQPTGAVLGWYGKGSSYTYAYQKIGDANMINPGCSASSGGLPTCPSGSIGVGVDFCIANGVATKAAILCKAYK
ncbi:MAG TPA: hypothetical protein DD400_00900 [Rhodospirillaceae bacterium]|nr:hypothetical protein [Rhodospirillaceae bacterium]